MPRKACTPSRTVPCTAPPEVWTVGVVAVTPRTLAPRPARTDPAAARGAPTCCTRPLDRGRRVEVTGGRERPSPLAAPEGVVGGGTVGGVRRRAGLVVAAVLDRKSVV